MTNPKLDPAGMPGARSEPGTALSRLAALGLKLPPVAAPVANYVGVRRSGCVLYIAGQISTDEQGVPAYLGVVGDSLSAADAQAAARRCALALLAQIQAATGGDLDRVAQVQRLGVFIAATPQFKDHAQVANGASDLLVAVFGERGRHVRTSVGVASLPRGVAVEVDAIVELLP